MDRQTISHRPETKTITDIANLFEDDLLNLEPGFQRQSVWSDRDRAKLIDSIDGQYDACNSRDTALVDCGNVMPKVVVVDAVDLPVDLVGARAVQ